MDTKTADFIDRMGLALESDGLPRIAGRIFGLLLVSEDCRSLDDLASELRVSKGSVSTNARLLEQRGVLERNSRPSDRRDYYRVPPDLFSHTMAQRLRAGSAFTRPSVRPAPPADPKPQGTRPTGGVRGGLRLHVPGHPRGAGALADKREAPAALAGLPGDRRRFRPLPCWPSSALACGGRLRSAGWPECRLLPTPPGRRRPGSAPREVSRSSLRCPPTWSSGSAGLRWPRWWTWVFATIRPPGCPGPTRGRPRRPTARSGAPTTRR